MNTQDWKILISAYADGALSPDEAAEAERLLAEKPEYQAYLAELRRLSMSLHVLKDETLSPDAEFKILSNTTKERSMKINYWRTSAAVAASVLVVVLAYNNLKTSIPGEVTPKGIIVQVPVPTPQPVQPVKPAPQPVQPVPQVQPAPQPMIPGQPAVTPPSPAPVTTPPLIPVTPMKQAYKPMSQPMNFMEKAKEAGKDLLDGARNYYEKKGQSNYAPAQLASRTEMADRRAMVTGGVSLQNTLQYEPYYTNTTNAPASASMEYWGAPASPGFNQYMQYGQGNTEEYAKVEENKFLTATDNPLSTFSIDVDTAAYSNIRRFLGQNQMPPRDAVRVEEMINYFSYNYPEPWFGQPFSVTTDLATCPWDTSHQLIRIGLKGRTPSSTSLPPSNLVFLIDVSGSMADANKLPLLKEGFKMMVRQLRPQDRVSIVVYASNAGLALSPTSGAEKYAILNAIDSLQANGSTAGGEGIQLAYDIARQSFIPGGNNRVVLATDGDFNVGISDPGDLERLIEEKRASGIFLTVLGFGQDNLKDNRMQVLADKGNGNYFYIDSYLEAQKVLVNELGSTLFTIAKDVKIQVEFNPALVKAYRLIGYEKRVMAKEDFNNDRKDAGEIGAGHTVTALYEIVPVGYWSNYEPVPSVDPLKYQRTAAPAFVWGTPSNEIATFKLRYKEPKGETSKLITKTLKKSDLTPFPQGDFAWASAVAEVGMLLRGSEASGNASYAQALSMAQSNIGNDKDGLRAEFINLIETARNLDPRPRPWPVMQDNNFYQYQQNDQNNGRINFKE